ncbi:extracellular solute-binding protein [Lachnoclostridium sp. An169]|uniref:extracellular solute-binding protein n=1 Tax=Lachnoclostridium sp. An169 TaxID=1965569 RepID=UPI0013A672EC|nr:extracellular solute-binding protein [Lachnoclostridium sp. An169]
MKGKMRKICTILVGASMVFSLTACSVQKSGDTPAKTSSAGEDGTGLSTMKVGFARDTSFSYQGDETAEDNAWLDLYRENGIELEVIYDVDVSQKTEKLSMCIMSGEYPDFMDVDAKNFTGWAEQGVFADLTDGFEKYASDEMKEYYSTEAGQRALKAATVDGKLYALPVVATPNDGMPILWIRKDWLDNLGLEAPKTVEEFYEVARAFAQDDPDQNGQNDTYGLALNGKDVFHSIGDVATFFEMFGAQPGYYSNVIPFIDVDGKAVYGGAKSEEMKEGLSMLRDMYDNGIISKDFVTAGQDQIFQDMAAGKVGMAFSLFMGAETPWKNALETQPDAEFISVPIPGKTEDDRGQAFYTALPSQYYTMSSKYDDMEAFFKVVNLSMHYLAQPDTLSQEEYEKYNGLAGKYTGYSLAVCGFAVPDKNMVGWGRIQEALKTGSTENLNAENQRDYNAMMAYYENRDRRSELDEQELAAFNAGVLYWSVYGADHCAYQTLHEMMEMDNYIYSAYDAAATEKMNECTTSLITLTKETLIDIITGNAEVDSYDTFLEQWNALGGAQITEEADEWYQESRAE